MPQDFKDEQTAQQWDADTRHYNPTRPEQLVMQLSIIEAEYQPGDSILDLGFGSGLVEEMIFKRIPGAQIVGVDSSQAMMKLAQERLLPYAAQYTAIEHDLRDLPSLPLEAGIFRFIISIQALHHLTDSEMQVAYEAIHDLLTPGGLFLLLDRVAIDKPALYGVYQTLWRWQDAHYGSRVADHEGATFAEYVDTLADRGDVPLALSRHLELMREAGLHGDCLHAHGIRALFAARKS
ncbi:MAG: class I SAM-dependent methyltransferase [Anaerolineae bacterium]|nr:class I SAM-dependent methyltransferase [Anaerolineae bacterium]